MSVLAMQTADMIKLLPDDALKTVNDLVRMLVKAWDPDFTKLTDEERDRIEKSEKEMEEGIYFTDNEIWDYTRERN